MKTADPVDLARIEWTALKPGSPGVASATKGVCRVLAVSRAEAMFLFHGRRSG